MIETPGKAAQRRFFYESYVPACFTPTQLASMDALILMGEEPREIPFLDALGFSRSSITSVERNYEIYEKQEGFNLGINMHFGEMADHLDLMLHQNHALRLAVLDIEGAHLHQLDPAMTSMLRFCRRNPSTLLATTASVGRDPDTLLEGAFSLALLAWYAPDAIPTFTGEVVAAYEAAGYEEPFRMALRDLFWLRSTFEHTVAAACPGSAERLLTLHATLGEELWHSVSAASPRTAGELIDLAISFGAASSGARELQLALDVRIREWKRVIYRGDRGWNQLCSYVLFERTPEVTSAAAWMRDTVERARATPLTHFDREGTRRDLPAADNGTYRAYPVPDNLAAFHPREVPSSDPMARIKSIQQRGGTYGTSKRAHRARGADRTRRTGR